MFDKVILTHTSQTTIFGGLETKIVHSHSLEC